MTPFTVRLLVASSIAVLVIFFSVGLFHHDLATDSVKQYASKYLPFARPAEDLDEYDLGVPAPSHADEEAAEEEEKLAYVTFFTGTVADPNETDINSDPYFVATRLLGYQLMHQTETRTQRNIPFVVLVSKDIPKAKTDRLAKDGAIIRHVDYVDTPSWVQGEMPQWADLMTKLRAWQMTEYSRALFLDGDMLLNRRMDGVFDDPATQPIAPTKSPTSALDASDAASLPPTYLLATMAEANPNHAYPPTAANNDYKDPTYFNAGFFVFAPSPEAYAHYYAILHRENSFDPKYVEQNLLNFAHRADGALPWQHVDTAWNIRFPNMRDKEAGVASMHDKWWHAHMDAKLQPYYTSLRWQMEGFYEAMDQGMLD